MDGAFPKYLESIHFCPVIPTPTTAVFYRTANHTNASSSGCCRFACQGAIFYHLKLHYVVMPGWHDIWWFRNEFLEESSPRTAAVDTNPVIASCCTICSSWLLHHGPPYEGSIRDHGFNDHLVSSWTFNFTHWFADSSTFYTNSNGGKRLKHLETMSLRQKNLVYCLVHSSSNIFSSIRYRTQNWTLWSPKIFKLFITHFLNKIWMKSMK